ncbi:MAG: hypothetical protein AAGG68_10245 [Bacteroidota bacterium]
MKTSDYQPISCDFYDVLEASATLKKKSIIYFYNIDWQEQQIVSRIKNLFTKEKEEFVELASGEIIRLDHLISVDGKVLSKVC